MNNYGQIVPTKIDRNSFLSDQNHFLELAKEEGLHTELYTSAFSPYPLAVTSDKLAQWVNLQGSIYRAVLAVVEHFHTDKRIQEVIALNESELNLVKQLKDHPYRPGGIRPDFLHAADGCEMITEINARFALNGFISSALLNQCIGKFDHCRPLPQLSTLFDTLQRRLGETGIVGIVKSSEPGWDINLLRKFLGKRCELVAPEDLTEAMLKRWKSVLVELHQDELLSQLPAHLQMSLATHPGLLNDFRSILIVHDKRLLSLLSTSDVLNDYLETTDLTLLRRHIIPTWVKGLSTNKVREAMEHTENWLAKPPRFGKGQGILISSHLGKSEWQKSLENIPNDWLLQPYIKQREFLITTLQGEEIMTTPMKVVGMLPQLDDRAFGAGFFRAAADDIVNVARSGLILAPTLLK